MKENEILSYIQNGDKKAFKQLYDTYRPNVYQTSLHYLKSSDLVEEVIQDVFMKIWTEKERLANVNSIKAWLYIMTKNNILNQLKKVGSEWKTSDIVVLGSSEVEDTTETANLKDMEYLQILNEVVQSLPKRQREVFEMVRFQYLSYNDIGEKLAISPLTVKSHMSRAINSVRLKMKFFGVELLFLFVIADALITT